MLQLDAAGGILIIFAPFLLSQQVPLLLNSLTQKNETIHWLLISYEPRHENTCFLNKQKQRRRSAAQSLCRVFVFAK